MSILGVWLLCAAVYLLLIVIVARVHHWTASPLAWSGKSSRLERENTCVSRETEYSVLMANVPSGVETPPVIRGYGIVPSSAQRPAPAPKRVHVFMADFPSWRWSTRTSRETFGVTILRFGRLRVMIRGDR